MRYSIIFLLMCSLVFGQVGKNLQVLKVKSKVELKRYMEGIASDLGVKCVFCHNMRDKSSDQNKHKIIAREMLKMTSMINNDFLNWENADQATCWTCHQGNKYPVAKDIE